MTLSELKDWLSKIPDEFSEYEIFTGGEKKEEDNYFFAGAAMIDDENYLVYTDLDGKIVNQNMPKEKIGV